MLISSSSSTHCTLSISGYSPLDLTILDPHWGTVSDWVDAIDSIHAHNMYLMVDFTIGTMSDLIGFEGYAALCLGCRRS